MKKAILRRYDITQESFWQQFWAAKKRSEESYSELTADFVEKWLKSYVRHKTRSSQFLQTLPEDVRFKRGTLPLDLARMLASWLMIMYKLRRKLELTARRKLEGGIVSSKLLRRTIASCLNHRNRKDGPHAFFTQDNLSDTECFNCHKKGIFLPLPTQRNVLHRTQVGPALSCFQVWYGTAEGKPVKEILLDTRCLRTLVCQDLVPK